MYKRQRLWETAGCLNGQSAKTLSHTNLWPVLDFNGNMETSELQRKLVFPVVKKPIRYHTACGSEFRITLTVRVEGWRKHA